MRIFRVAVTLAALAGCKGKKNEAGAPPTSGSGSASAVASGSGSAGPPAASEDAGMAAGSGSSSGSAAGESPFVTLGAAALHGCLGWSAAHKVAACITGMKMSNETSEYVLDFVGAQEPAHALATSRTDFGDALPPQTTSAANEALAKHGIAAFPTPAVRLDKPGTTELGKGASFVWTSKQTDKGGANKPPTNKHAAKITCGKASVTVIDSEAEGVNPTFEVWNVGDHVVVEITVTTGREGEFGKAVKAMLVDLATCKAVRSGAPATP